MKRSNSKLKLGAETVRLLRAPELRQAFGGLGDNTIDESACAPTHDGPSCVCTNNCSGWHSCQGSCATCNAGCGQDTTGAGN